MKVGFIGLGNAGGKLAGSLLRNGFDLTVRDLNKKTDVIAEQSYSERQLYEKAYDRILNEFQIVLGISHEQTQKKLDKALKRI